MLNAFVPMFVNELTTESNSGSLYTEKHADTRMTHWSVYLHLSYSITLTQEGVCVTNQRRLKGERVHARLWL